VLALCTIARDEEARIGRALASVAGVVDELVVVDTGSRDATREVARAHGARVVDFAWCDDFAAARSFALAQTRAEWVLWLDADEALRPESRAELGALVGRESAIAAYVVREDLACAERPDVYSEMWLLRLFRRRAGTRLLGRCHSRFVPSYEELALAEAKRVEYAARVRIRHDGFAQARRPEKLRRGVRLLELELGERPESLHHRIEYARALLDLGDARAPEAMAEAAARIARAAGEPSQPDRAVPLVLEHLLLAERVPAHGALPPDLAARLAHRWFPRSAPLLRARALRLLRGGRAGEAAGLLRRLQGHAARGELDRSVPYDARILRDDTTWALAVASAQAGDREAARRGFESLLGSETHAERAARNLALLAAPAPDAERRPGDVPAGELE
jgi:hypothetical protein